MNRKSRPIKSNFEQYQVLFNYISSKKQWSNISIWRKNLILRSFFLKGNFSYKLWPCKTSGPPNSSNHSWDTPDLRVTWSIRPHPFLIIIIKVTFSFPKISSFHQFVLEIEQSLESQEQKGHVYFLPPPAKNY